MNIRIIEHPLNPTRWLIQKKETGGEWEKIKTVDPSYVTRNLTIVGVDKDPLLVQFLKAETLSPRGFSNLQNANTKIGQEDWDQILTDYGITLEELLFD